MVDSYFNYHPQLSDDKVQLYPMLLENRMKGSPLILFFCSGKPLAAKNHPSPYSLGKTHECLLCLPMTRSVTDPLNPCSLPHK